MLTVAIGLEEMNQKPVCMCVQIFLIFCLSVYKVILIFADKTTIDIDRVAVNVTLMQ